jgi:hypothetical protein
LKDLPLEVLIDVLSSARPLHQVLQQYLRRKRRGSGETIGNTAIDPHKRVDTSQFLLQRTRRMSAALAGLRERLQRPVATLESLRWRLNGPVGVLALAKALEREARSEGEKVFLLSELALELSRVTPQEAPGALASWQVRSELDSVIQELKGLIPGESADEPENLREYVQAVFDEIKA